MRRGIGKSAVRADASRSMLAAISARHTASRAIRHASATYSSSLSRYGFGHSKMREQAVADALGVTLADARHHRHAHVQRRRRGIAAGVG